MDQKFLTVWEKISENLRGGIFFDSHCILATEVLEETVMLGLIENYPVMKLRLTKPKYRTIIEGKRPKRPMDQNGPQLYPKRPTAKPGFRSLATLNLVVNVVGVL